MPVDDRPADARLARHGLDRDRVEPVPLDDRLRHVEELLAPLLRGHAHRLERLFRGHQRLMLQYRKLRVCSFRRRNRPTQGVKMNENEHVDIAILGSGFSGLGMAVRLRQQGLHDFVVLERGDEVGGTWWYNTYPGCACDVPSHLYSFSF